MTLIIQLATPSLNEFFARKHWTRRNELKNVWHRAVWVYKVKHELWPIDARHFPVDIVTRSHFRKTHEKHRLDTSNTFLANKMVEDAIVKAGLLPDDSAKYVRDHIVRQPVYGVEDPYVEVLIFSDEPVNPIMGTP